MMDVFVTVGADVYDCPISVRVLTVTPFKDVLMVVMQCTVASAYVAFRHHPITSFFISPTAFCIPDPSLYTLI